MLFTLIPVLALLSNYDRENCLINVGTEAKAAPRKNRAWFERKVAELKIELEKLPADRQEQFERELDREVEE